MAEKICTVVVTHNRLILLQECIDALRNQTKKTDEIIVVNNNSTDGTKEWLEKQSDITKIHQENLGGAGGFHNGMKLAYVKGYDWIWLMDDDCLPEIDSLRNLFKEKSNKNIVLNSIILTRNDRKKINFGFYDYVQNEFYDDITQLNKNEKLNGAGFFNGTLISDYTIKKVGYPLSDFFIYGDEYEYYSRIINNKIHIQTIVNSVVLHPYQKHKYIGKEKLNYRYNYFNKLGAKYFARNLTTIWYYSKSFRLRRLLKTFVFDLYGIIFVQLKFPFFFQYILSIIRAPLFILKLRKLKKYYS
jgi:rhamnopyranosyl-N-acetylglucosaminyl-diphospho-decaprenol beta-1,3/1,4-galactofuranosyltransferase